MKKLLPLFMFFTLLWFLPAQEKPDPVVKTTEEKRLETLRFGTETEIAALIQSLKNEKISYLDNDLIDIAKKTKNKGILSGIFGFFGETERKGLEERAIRAITEKDDESNDTVLAAVDYLGKVKAAEAIDCLQGLINSGEARFINNAFRALGRAASSAPGSAEAQIEPVPAALITAAHINAAPAAAIEQELAFGQETVIEYEPPGDMEADAAQSPAAHLSAPELSAGPDTGMELAPEQTQQSLAELNTPTEQVQAQQQAQLAPKDSAASFLLDYYKNRLPAEEYKREIITAIGETGSKEGVAFLSELVRNVEERPVLRMAALDALAKIGDPGGFNSIVESISSTDPNIRSTAVAALGPFSGEEVDGAILEAFRDSYYRTRIGAAQSAAKRRLESAVPYLRYRAENDEVAAVKDEAIRALGAINNAEAMSFLDSLFTERKNGDRVRIMAAEMLIKNDAAKYGSRVFIEMEDAKSKNQIPLYNGFVRIMVPAKSPELEDLARRFIAVGGVIEKSLALDLILNNEYRSMETEIRDLLDEKKHSASIAGKAKNTLAKLGL